MDTEIKVGDIVWDKYYHCVRAVELLAHGRPMYQTHPGAYIMDGVKLGQNADDANETVEQLLNDAARALAQALDTLIVWDMGDGEYSVHETRRDTLQSALDEYRQAEFMFHGVKAWAKAALGE